MPMPRISFGHRCLVCERVSNDGGVGPQHQLIVVVRVRLVELARQRDGIELALARRSARRPRRRSPGRSARVAQVDGAEIAGVAGRDADDGIAEATSPYFISIVPFGRSVACAVIARVESKPRTAHQVTVY